ncbi:hypothetical protein ABT234_34535 [Streptomyces sp. NPDC001586]|uniref:hypothetical protein n=1 Tax=Streptomyces sp. NPDC001586 TaxID=3154387 RepID=UPI003323B170
MRGPDRWLRRTSRGLLCASACLSLGAAGHIAAGGRLPGAGDLALVFAGLTVLGTLLFGGRRRRFDVTTLVLGATQFVLHLAFHRLSMPGGSPLPAMASMSDGMGGRQAMAGHAPPGAHEAMSAAAMTHPGSGHAMTTTMTLAHALATFGTSCASSTGSESCGGWALCSAPASAFAEQRPCPYRPSADCRSLTPPSTSVPTCSSPAAGPGVALPR